MSTPERQQDPGEYGYGGVEQEPDAAPHDAEHPLEDPDNDSGQDSGQDEPRREQPDTA